MTEVRIGLIGLGGIARLHSRYILNGEVPGAKIVAICDTDPVCLQQSKHLFGEKVDIFSNSDKMVKSGLIDAIIITTPHYHHPPLAML